jgi:hypothetical protein
VNENELKPGEKVEITIKTKPNSLVGLLAVDVRTNFKAGMYIDAIDAILCAIKTPVTLFLFLQEMILQQLAFMKS